MSKFMISILLVLAELSSPGKMPNNQGLSFKNICNIYRNSIDKLQLFHESEISIGKEFSIELL